MLDPAGEAEPPREIGDDGNDVEAGKTLLEVRGALLEIVAGDVDGDVGSWSDCLEQHGRLGLRTRAELNDRGALWHPSRDLWHDRVENRGLGPRRIIRREAGDLVEQLGAAAVIEPARGDRGGRCRQARE